MWLYYLIKRQSCHHVETSQLISRANQLAGFYMMVTLAFNELRTMFHQKHKYPFLYSIYGCLVYFLCGKQIFLAVAH